MSGIDPVAVIKRQQGSMNQKEYARAIGISQQYLGDIYRRRREPGPTVLKYVGLEKVVTYRVWRKA